MPLVSCDGVVWSLDSLIRITNCSAAFGSFVTGRKKEDTRGLDNLKGIPSDQEPHNDRQDDI